MGMYDAERRLQRLQPALPVYPSQLSEAVSQNNIQNPQGISRPGLLAQSVPARSQSSLHATTMEASVQQNDRIQNHDDSSFIQNENALILVQDQTINNELQTMQTNIFETSNGGSHLETPPQGLARQEKFDDTLDHFIEIVKKITKAYCINIYSKELI